MASYSRDTKVVLLANVIGLLAGIGTQSLLAYLLGPEGRGQYAVSLTVFAALIILSCALGQEIANMYFVGSGKSTPSEAMSQSLVVGAVTSLVACVVGYALTLAPLPFFDRAPISVFRWSLLTIPPTIFATYLSRIFAGMSRFTIYASLTTGLQSAVLIGLLICAGLGLSVTLAIMVFAAAQALMAVASFAILRYGFGCRIVAIDGAKLRSSLHYGVRVYIGKLCSMANIQIGTIVLAFSQVTTGQIGLFAAAVAIVTKLWMLPEAMQTAILPRSAAHRAGESELVARSIRMSILASAAVGIVIVVFCKPIVQALLSGEFMPAVWPMCILVPGVVVRCVSKILPGYFNGVNRPGITSFSMAVAIAVNAGLLTLFVPLWGLNGAALAMTGACFTEALTMAVFFKRLSGLSFEAAFAPRRSDYHALRDQCRQVSGKLLKVGVAK